MLVLSRRIGETLVIDNNITVKVLDIQGNRIKVGIEAPRETQIVRYEAWVEMQGEGGESAA